MLSIKNEFIEFMNNMLKTLNNTPETLFTPTHGYIMSFVYKWNLFLKVIFIKHSKEWMRECKKKITIESKIFKRVESFILLICFLIYFNKGIKERTSRVELMRKIFWKNTEFIQI